MKRSTPLLLLAVLVLFVQQVHAYDKTGHRIVAAVATAQLTTKAKLELEKIMGKNGLIHYANWADEIRSDRSYDYTSHWHFYNVDKDLTAEELDGEYQHALEKKDNILFTIDSLINVLKKNKRDTIALRFLVHFMGDLHQPLHFGRFADLGGNRIKIKWMSDSINLHSLWDTYMVSMEQLSYTEYTQYLTDKSNFQQLKADNTWTVKSAFKRCYQVSRKAYSYKYEGMNPYVYYYNFSPDVKELLARGGCLLAATLNKIYG